MITLPSPSPQLSHSPEEEFRELLAQERAASASARKELTFAEWQRNNVAPHLRACLAFYYKYPQDALRWDAIVLAHQAAIRYHTTLLRIEAGGHTWFPKSPEINGRPPMMDEVLNSSDFAKVLLIADWALEHEELDPVVYAMLAGGRAERQLHMDAPTTRQMRRNKAPAAAFAGRLAQSKLWLRNLEQRFPGVSIMTTPPRHGRWYPESAHEEVAKAYFYCLVHVVPQEEYLAELRRYRRGSIVKTAVEACDSLKNWAQNPTPFEERDEPAPILASEARLRAAAEGSAEAIYLEFLNEARQQEPALRELRQQRSTTPECRSRWGQVAYVDVIERTLRAVDRLQQHPLRWRAIAYGFNGACDALQWPEAREDARIARYLQSMDFKRMESLGLAALQADDLDPGVYGKLLISRMGVLRAEIEQARQGEQGGKPGHHAKHMEEQLAEVRELYRGITRRWPTLFEFNEQGDAYDWYADKCFRIATERYLDLLESAGFMAELEAESARVASGPHPGAARAARLMKHRLEVARQVTL